MSVEASSGSPRRIDASSRRRPRPAGRAPRPRRTPGWRRCSPGRCCRWRRAQRRRRRLRRRHRRTPATAPCPRARGAPSGAPGRECHHASTGRGGPGDGDHVDVGVGHERLAHLGVAGDHRERAVGQAGLGGEFGEADRGARRGGCRLEHHGASCCERRTDLPHRHDEGEVPRRDRATVPAGRRTSIEV
jgi:hypothetical protein